MVVITGVGTLSAAGSGRTALAAGLALGRPRLRDIAERPGWRGRLGSRRAALVNPAMVEGALAGHEARRMSPPSRFAVAAARAALVEAGLQPASEPDPGLAVVAATAFGPSSFTQRLFDQILDEGPACASPALFTECVANAAVAQVNAGVRAAGPSYALSQGEAGPLRAVARAAAEIAAGRCASALAGAVEEIPDLVHALLDRCRALARPRPDGDERARPFDRDRDGFHAAEGATFLVLEEESAARRRGAVPLARLRGGFSAFDASASAGGWGVGSAALGQALLRGLDRCGLGPPDIDLIVSGASGSRAGDRLEALHLAHAWGGRALPPVLAPKAVTGEYGGAFLAAAVLAVEGKGGGSTPWFEAPDEECGVRPHQGAIPPGVQRVLITGLAAGGPASWLLLERP